MINGGYFNKKRVLIAPLDWGLGHATRCIPLIKELLINDCEVLIASTGVQAALLKEEFPALFFVDLKGYNVTYSRNKKWLPIKLLGQIPAILSSISYEHKWLKKTIKEYQIDVVISDNRFGLYHSTVHCIYITHQLQIKTGYRFTDWLARKLHYHYINKYQQCWVPDAAGEKNLGGELSHPKKLPGTTVQYIGPLSRFEINKEEMRYPFLILISGPEPQRTVFEEMALKELQNYKERVLFIRGLPGNVPQLSPSNTAIEIHNHLTASLLNKAILQSEIIICRSGYTTIMDLIKLNKKAVVVPTPGQTEQEYLAGYLMEQNIFYCQQQKDFSLEVIEKTRKKFPFRTIEINTSEYKKVIKAY